MAKKKRGPGRPKVVLACPMCHGKFGTWELQRHVSTCKKRPKVNGNS